MKLEIKKSKTFSDKTGSLIPFYKNGILKNFSLVRFFFVYGNKKYYRANHAHKKCNQIQPQTPNIMFNLALGLQGTGKIKDAEKIYLDLLTINPKDIKSYYALFSLNIDNINPKFYKNLKVLIKEEKISLFEKSLINFILSQVGVIIRCF